MNGIQNEKLKEYEKLKEADILRPTVFQQLIQARLAIRLGSCFLCIHKQ
jgi:hypothetical protein